jgi:hypothetical protein
LKISYKNDFEEETLSIRSFNGSRMLTDKKDINWLLSQIPSGAKKIKILFDPLHHGWHVNSFHRVCDGHPNPTIIVIKSKA